MDANAAQIINNSASSIDTKIAEEIYKRNVELLDQRRRAEELLYGIAEGVLAVDTGLRITLFNNTLEKMLRLRKEEAIGKANRRYHHTNHRRWKVGRHKKVLFI